MVAVDLGAAGWDFALSSTERARKYGEKAGFEN